MNESKIFKFETPVTSVAFRPPYNVVETLGMSLNQKNEKSINPTLLEELLKNEMYEESGMITGCIYSISKARYHINSK